MEDLSIATPPGQTTFPLGGGNPAHIHEVQEALRESARALTDSRSRFASMIGDYDAPQGHEKFRCALAAELSKPVRTSDWLGEYRDYQWQSGEL